MNTTLDMGVLAQHTDSGSEKFNESDIVGGKNELSFWLEPSSDTSPSVEAESGGESAARDLRPRDPVVLRPVYTVFREHFNVLQKWEGYVLEITDESFWARLTPLVGDMSEYEAEILLDEVPFEDHDLIENGAIFYWSIGYLNKPSGRLRASIIRFQRLPRWSAYELSGMNQEVEKLKSLINAE